MLRGSLDGRWVETITTLFVYRLSCVRLSQTPWPVAHQDPLPMGFSRREYWSGLPFPSPRDLPGPGIETTPLMSPALAGGFFTSSTTWETFNPSSTWACAVLSHSVVSDSRDPMDCSPPGSSVHGISQARVLEWIAVSFSRGSSQPRDWT